MESFKTTEISGYKVTDDPKVIKDIFGITNEINNFIEIMYEKVERKKNSAITELTLLTKKYPHIPQFKNLLSTIHENNGNLNAYHEVNRRLHEEHPDYLFGKINLAIEFIENKQYDKVPEILGEKMEIKDLYPGRNEFHVKEVISFLKTAIYYFLKIENLVAAESRLVDLKNLCDVFENLLTTDQRMKIELSFFGLRMAKGHERTMKLREKARTVEVIPVKVVEQTNEKPIFQNDIIEQLYCNSMRISHDLVREILLLPRETLISDLHKVIYDSMARLDYFSNETDWHGNTHEFVIHAIFLLVELKSDESLDVLLDILRQDEDYLDYWFNDMLTEDAWEFCLILGFNKLDKLKNFLFEPHHYLYARTVISTTVSQIALYYPERRNEIIDWYRDVIEEILAQKNDESIIDTDWIGFIVGDLLDIKAIELSPLVKELFDLELVSEDISGSYDDFIDELKTGKYSYDRKLKTFNTIFSRYANILTRWDYYKKKKDLLPHNPGDDDSVVNENINDTKDTHHYPIRKQEDSLLINPNKNIGRNDPCPCGSGKKYKKCCLKNI